MSGRCCRIGVIGIYGIAVITIVIRTVIIAVRSVPRIVVPRIVEPRIIIIGVCIEPVIGIPVIVPVKDIPEQVIIHCVIRTVCVTETVQTAGHVEIIDCIAVTLGI